MDEVPSAMQTPWYLELNNLFFVPKHNPLSIFTTLIPSPVVANLIKSGVADKAAPGFLLAAAAGLLATFLPKLTVTLSTLLEKSFNPSASIVASLTAIDLFLLQLTQLPLKILVPFEVTKPLMLLVPLQCRAPTQGELVLNLLKLPIILYIKNKGR